MEVHGTYIVHFPTLQPKNVKNGNTNEGSSGKTGIWCTWMSQMGTLMLQNLSLIM